MYTVENVNKSLLTLSIKIQKLCRNGVFDWQLSTIVHKLPKKSKVMHRLSVGFPQLFFLSFVPFVCLYLPDKILN
jgi:hypothetical protein